jgi:hypothetical protein
MSWLKKRCAWCKDTYDRDQLWPYIRGGKTQLICYECKACAT